ncbi:MAG: CDP-archaeol synthase [Nanoarchaeota archaeon]
MLTELITNKIVLSVFFATALSQLLKTYNKYLEEKVFDIRLLWETGGMPSSHAALASSLALATVLVEGVTTVSLVTVAICIVFIRDAFGLRREAGEQAKVINKIVADLRLERKLNVKKLKELVGHNFFQVIMGIFVGIISTLIVFNLYDANFAILLIWFLTSVYYALPGLIANMMPVFFKRRLKFLAKPIDFGAKLNGVRMFGSHKTIRGFVVAIAGGLIVGLIQFLIKDLHFIQAISYVEYTFASALLIGTAFGFGALVGDALESLLKRQLNIKPGKPFIPLDQIDYIIGIAAFSFLFKPLTLHMFLTLLIAGAVMSVIATKIGYLSKIRKEKW